MAALGGAERSAPPPAEAERVRRWRRVAQDAALSAQRRAPKSCNGRLA